MASFMHKHSSRNEAQKLDFTSLSDRESSFHNTPTRWPSSLPSSESMAEAGFYFTPNDKYSDCVTCFRCGIKMYNWLPDDTPKAEHKIFNPSCKEVKSWSNVVIDEDRRSINRAEQTDSRIRHKLANKAKKISEALHRKHDAKPADVMPASSTPMEDTTRPLNDEEKLADVRRRLDVGRKALDGLEKLASFYPNGSQEHVRAEQSIALQAADVEKLREEEERLASAMGSLSFGRGWHDISESPIPHSYAPSSSYSSKPAQQANEEDDLSPEVERGRAKTRALPQLPSQLHKDSMPRMPAPMQRSQDVTQMMPDSQHEPSAYGQYDDQYATSQMDEKESEWIEYKTEDGTPYYYSTITKNTVWQIPDHSSLNPVTSV